MNTFEAILLKIKSHLNHEHNKIGKICWITRTAFSLDKIYLAACMVMFDVFSVGFWGNSNLSVSPPRTLTTCHMHSLAFEIDTYGVLVWVWLGAAIAFEKV